MPRGIKGSGPKERKDVAKVHAQEHAEQLLNTLKEYQQDLDNRTLETLANQPVSDIEAIRAEYRASRRLISWLTSKINDGKRASRRLDEE